MLLLVGEEFNLAINHLYYEEESLIKKQQAFGLFLANG